MDPLLPLNLPILPPAPPGGGASAASASAAALATGIVADVEAALAETAAEAAAGADARAGAAAAAVADIIVGTGETAIPATLIAPPSSATGEESTAAVAAGLPAGTQAAIRLIAVTPPPATGNGGDEAAAVEILLSPGTGAAADHSDETVNTGIVSGPREDIGGNLDREVPVPAATTIIASPLGTWALARPLALPAETLVRFALLLPQPSAAATAEPADESAGSGEPAPFTATLIGMPERNGGGDSGTDAAAPSLPIALRPGMQAVLRLLTATLPGSTPEGSRPVAIRFAAPAAVANEVEISGIVTAPAAPEAAGDAPVPAAPTGMVIVSPLGTWVPARPLALPADTLVRFALLLRAASATQAAGTTPTPPAAPATLGDVVRAALAAIGCPAEAETAAPSAGIRSAFASPRSAPQLAAALALAAATITEQPESGTGAGIDLPSPVAALARLAADAGRSDLAAALAKAALPSPSAVPDGSAPHGAAPARWTEIALPVLDDTGTGSGTAPRAAAPADMPMPPVMLLLEDRRRAPIGDGQDGENSGRDSDRTGGRRFAVTLELSRLGPVRIDGAVRRGDATAPGSAGRHHLALTVRTGTALPATLRNGLAETFATALDAAGFTGTLTFAALSQGGGRSGGGERRRPVDLHA